jgi:hypothetical protein
LFDVAAPGYASTFYILPTPEACMTSTLVRTTRAAAALLLATAAACGDPFRVDAQFDTVEREVVFVALSGTSPALSAGVLIAPEPQAVRVGPDLFFDLAFDIEDNGTAVLLPVDAVGRPGVTGSRTVGVLKLTGQTFESVQRAPAGGYTLRQAVPIAAGDVGVLQALVHPACAGSFISSTVFAKFRVEAVDVPTRSIRLRILTNPNCGFRGLETGRPSR